MWLYSGPDHFNVTAVVENNGKIVQGAPVSVAVDDSAVIILNLFDPATDTVTINYQVEGTKYPWYE